MGCAICARLPVCHFNLHANLQCTALHSACRSQIDGCAKPLCLPYSFALHADPRLTVVSNMCNTLRVFSTCMPIDTLQLCTLHADPRLTVVPNVCYFLGA